MELKIYAADAATLKYTLAAVQAATLHQTLEGECTLALTMPGRAILGITVGDEIRLGDLYFNVTRVAKSGQPAGVSYGVTAEHISYGLTDKKLAEGEYTGSPSAILATILSGTGLSVGTVTVTGTKTMKVSAGTTRRAALLNWAAACGAEISYYRRSINLLSRVGSSAQVLLSDKENVKSLSVTLDNRSDTRNYTIELSRLQHLGLGDAVLIAYSSLNLSESTRVVSLDYDPFHPMAISMSCGTYVPNYYDAVDRSIAEAEEEIAEDMTVRLAEAQVDSLSTSKRQRLYILEDDSDDNYVLIQDNYVRMVTAEVVHDEDDPTLPLEQQDTDRFGRPLYWLREPVGSTPQGEPLDADGNRIYATIVETDWPVMVYQYTDHVKSAYTFEDADGVYEPQIVLGEGNELGYSRGHLLKQQFGLLLRYVTSSGEDVDIRFGDDGFVDAQHRRLVSLNLNTSTHTITYTLEGDASLHTMTYSESGGVVTYRWGDGHTCQISIPDDWGEGGGGGSGPIPSDAPPIMDGSAYAGASSTYARGDHVHPTDSSRASAAALSAHVGDTSNPHEVTKAQLGLGNVENERQYSADNPPPYPVTSVNGSTGAVTLGAADVGAQEEILASGILKGDGAGGVAAAVAGTDYQAPISPYASNPAMDGTASPGSSGNWARGDHVHPSDTTRQAKITAFGVLEGDGDGGISAAYVDVAPTENSGNLVESGGVYEAIRKRPRVAALVLDTARDVHTDTTITLDVEYDDYSYLSIVFDTVAPTDPTEYHNRAVLVVPTFAVRFSGHYPVVGPGVSGYVRLSSVSGQPKQIRFQATNLSTLWVRRIDAVR